MRIWKLALAAVVVLLPMHVGVADDEYEQAMARARALMAAGVGTPQFAELTADSEDIDRWLEVDALLSLGARKEAAAVAQAHTGPDAPALQALAARAPRDATPMREALAAAEAEMNTGTQPGADLQASATKALRLLRDTSTITPSVLRTRCHEFRASVAASVERWHDAAVEYGAAAETAEKIGWSPRAVVLWEKCATAANKDHDLRMAVRTFERLANAYNAVGNPTKRAQALSDAAEVYLRFGEPQSAASRLEEALRSLPAGKEPELHSNLGGRLGATLAELGRRAEGLAMLEKSIQDLAALAPTPHLAIADAEVDRGNLLRELGDIDGARAAYTRALDAYGKADEAAGDGASDLSARVGLVTSRANLAAILVEDHRYADAAREYDAVRAGFIAVDDRPMAARARQGAADARVKEAHETTDLAKRRELIREAREWSINAAAESVAEHDPVGVLYARGTQGDVEAEEGHDAAAVAIFSDVVKEASERGIASLVLEYVVRLAELHLKAENVGAALAAVETGFHWLETAQDGRGDVSRIQARHRHGELFSLGTRAALLSPQGERAKRMFRYIEIGRAANLLDSLENRDVLRSRRVSPAREQARREAARNVVSAREGVAAAGDDVAEIRAATARLAEAQAAYERTVDAIQSEARIGANLLYPQPILLEYAQRMLEPRQALVLYAITGDDAYALCVTRNAAEIVDLKSSTVAVVRCRETLVRSPTPDAASIWRDAATCVLEPVESVLADAEKALGVKIDTVYVSPDGDLGLVPFPALRPPPAQRTFLFIPSASTLHVLADEPARSGVETLAVGIADYKSPSRRSEAGGGARFGLAPLPMAEIEAEAVGTRRLLGNQATEGQFFRLLGQVKVWRAVHFAVHGLTADRNPSLACLALLPSGDSDGDLTAFEILQHDIPADIAVLAACDSAVGRRVDGEGLMGLVRAFLFAGTPAVVAHLWNANDDAAKAFSVGFHAAWRTGASMATALEAGRAAVRANPNWAHPYYWAGWCGWGER